jgi:hypothetical protein
MYPTVLITFHHSSEPFQGMCNTYHFTNFANFDSTFTYETLDNDTIFISVQGGPWNRLCGVVVRIPGYRTEMYCFL